MVTIAACHALDTTGICPYRAHARHASTPDKQQTENNYIDTNKLEIEIDIFSKFNLKSPSIKAWSPTSHQAVHH